MGHRPQSVVHAVRGLFDPSVMMQLQTLVGDFFQFTFVYMDVPKGCGTLTIHNGDIFYSTIIMTFALCNQDYKNSFTEENVIQTSYSALIQYLGDKDSMMLVKYRIANLPASVIEISSHEHRISINTLSSGNSHFFYRKWAVHTEGDFMKVNFIIHNFTGYTSKCGYGFIGLRYIIMCT